MTMKTRARVSFIVDIDDLNRQRRLLGRPDLTEQEFFTLLSDKQAVIIASYGKDHLSFEAALGYIVS